MQPSAFSGFSKPPSIKAPQAKLAREQLAAQGVVATNPTPREQAIAQLRTRPKSPALGFGRRRRKTYRRKGRRTTRRKL